MSYRLVLLQLLVWSARISAGLPESPAEYAIWETRSLEAVAKLPSLPTDEAIAELGLRMLQLSHEHTSNWEHGDRPVFHAAQKALLAIPGHAEYYRDRINDARVKLEDIKKGGRSSYIAHYRSILSNEVTDAFPTLAQLPSAETVRVLGGFLFDERGYVKLPLDPTLLQLEDAVIDSPVFRKAARTLWELPIVKKPVPAKRRYETPEDVLPWRQWYEEIKAGKRTFRFEGDPTEYDLNGPASKELIQRVERDRKRDEERANRSNKNNSVQTGGLERVTATPGSTAGIVAAVLGIIAAGWYFWRKKTQHA